MHPIFYLFLQITLFFLLNSFNCFALTSFSRYRKIKKGILTHFSYILYQTSCLKSFHVFVAFIMKYNTFNVFRIYQAGFIELFCFNSVKYALYLFVFSEYVHDIILTGCQRILRFKYCEPFSTAFS